MIYILYAIYVLPSRPVFFFFNDPPPTEISPLSLHDALPISDPRHQTSPAGVTWTTNNFAEALPDVPTPLSWSIWQPAMEDAAAWSWRELGVLAPGEEDRKSTRLNSSHSQISYAVFCLEKKKK